MQPADVAAFKPLKNGWPKAVQRFREKNPNGSVNAHNFATVLQDCLRNSLTVKTIQNGFRASGLYPWNRDAIDSSKCLGKTTAREDPTESSSEPIHIELPSETSKQLQQAKRTLEECAAAIGGTRIKKYKTDFVCLDTEEDAALFRIYSTLERNFPDLMNTVEENVEERVQLCSFDYSDIVDATPVTNEVPEEIGTQERTPDEAQKLIPDAAIPGPSRTPLKEFLNTPSTPKRASKREYKSKRYHVLTSDEFVQEFKQKEEDKKRAEEEKENRKVIRLQRKIETETKKKKKQEEKILKQQVKGKACRKKA